MLVQVRYRRRGNPWGAWQDVDITHSAHWLLDALRFVHEGTITTKTSDGHQHQWKVISK